MSLTSEDIRLKECLYTKISSLDKREPYIWRLKISPSEYQLLHDSIIKSIESHDGCITHLLSPDFALHIITYLAEWYKRSYNGSKSGEKAIEPNSEQLKKLWENSGIDIEKYVYRQESTGNRLWQYSTYVLGGLSVQLELSKQNNRFLKGLCKILHKEEYTLENLHNEDRAIAFRNSIRNYHSLFYFLTEIVNGRKPFDDSDLVDLHSDANKLIERIRHANDEVMKEKFRFEWLIYHEAGCDYMQRKLRLWFNIEEVGLGIHHYLRYDRVFLWGFTHPEEIKRLYISLKFIDGDTVIQDVNFQKPTISYLNTGDESTGFIAQGVDRYAICHNIPTKRFSKIEIWAKDNLGNPKCIQEQVSSDFMQVWRVSPYEDVWSSKSAAQKETAVVFTNNCKLELDSPNESPERIPFKDKVYGYSETYGWYYIYDQVTIIDESDARTTLYNRIGYDQVKPKLYRDVISYSETGSIRYLFEDDEDYGEIEEEVSIIFNPSDIIIKHFATKDDILNATPEYYSEAEIIKFKRNGNYIEWNDVQKPDFGLNDLVIEVKERRIPLKVFYMPPIAAEKPIVRDFSNQHIIYNSWNGSEIKQTVIEDNITLGETPLHPTHTIVIYTGQGRVEIPIFRPTLVREICRNKKVVEHIDNSDVIIPYIHKEDITVNCFTEAGYTSYQCKNIPSVYTKLDNSANFQLVAWANDTRFEANELDEYAPECLKISFGINSRLDDCLFLKWNYYADQEPEPCSYDEIPEQNSIIFQSLENYPFLSCIIPKRGKYSPFQYRNIKNNISLLKCFDIAILHNTYFFIFFPFSQVQDFKKELYEPLLEDRHGILSESDKQGLKRISEEFNFDWATHKVEL